MSPIIISKSPSESKSITRGLDLNSAVGIGKPAWFKDISTDKGTVLEKNDIAIKIPGDGTPPHDIDLFIGKKINVSISKDENLHTDHVS